MLQKFAENLIMNYYLPLYGALPIVVQLQNVSR